MKHTLALAVVLALGAGAAHAKSCTDPTTHKFIKCPAAAPLAPAKPIAAGTPAAPMHPMMSPASTASAKKVPNCTKGKLCGSSCISKNDICHKPS